jgi:hypothetical protein
MDLASSGPSNLGTSEWLLGTRGKPFAEAAWGEREQNPENFWAVASYGEEGKNEARGAG